MKKQIIHIPVFVGALFFLVSCAQSGQHQNHGPIILGDSSTIVTETNPQNLHDIVADLRPNIPTPSSSTPPPETASKQATDSSSHTAPQSAPAPIQARAIDGLNIPFKEIMVSFPGINTKSYRPQNLAASNSATYQLVSPTLAGKQLIISNGSATKVMQHYQTIIVLKNDLGTLPLETLNNLTDWETLNGKNNTYPISGLSGKLEAAEFNMNALHKAISKSARKHRLSRTTEKYWINSVSNARTNKKTINTVLRYVSWKIDGKTPDGKNFSKQVRIDLPTPEYNRE